MLRNSQEATSVARSGSSHLLQSILSILPQGHCEGSHAKRAVGSSWHEIGGAELVMMRQH